MQIAGMSTFPLVPCLSAVMLAAIALTPLRAAEPSITKTDLYEGGTNGYAAYRNPGLVVTGNGTMLAFAEARTTTGDWADIDIRMRRSTDGGKTWSDEQTIADGGDKPASNAVGIWDRTQKAVHFLYEVNYANVYYIRSNDDGKTFSAPTDITPALEKFREKYDWHVIAVGPGHSLELSNGRLVVPLWMSIGIHNHRPSVMATIFSDDHGKTWQCGEILPEVFTNQSETSLVELPGGKVMLFIRNEDPKYRVATSVSPDGATGWTAPTLNDDLYTPICFSSVLTLTKTPESDKTRLLFCNPDSRTKTDTLLKWGARQRENVSVKISYDEGKTWPESKTVEPGHSGYSDLSVSPDGWIYSIYERGEALPDKIASKGITIARFNLEWLTDGKDSLAGDRAYSATPKP